MQVAFIVHGSEGNPSKHWYPWLKSKLEEKGLKVFSPQFPTGEDQTLENWFKTIEPLKDQLENSILIGHSLGAPFILNILNQWSTSFKAVFLVSGFEGHLEVEDEPNIEDFSERDFNWEKIKEKSKKFIVIHSDNDPYIQLEKAEELAQKLDVQITLVKGGEHFQEQSGFKTFELLFNKVKEQL